jgi:iron complex outermembrane receptor protein
MAKAALTWPLLDQRLTASLDGWYMSARRTLLGGQADSSIVANFTLLAARIRERFEISASVYNLFDEQYADPGSQPLPEDLIPRDGRNFRLKVSYRF